MVNVKNHSSLVGMVEKYRNTFKLACFYIKWESFCGVGEPTENR